MNIAEAKFDAFRIEVLQRLTTIETTVKAVAPVLLDHETRLRSHDKTLNRAMGAAAAIGAGMGATVSAAWHWLQGK